MRGRLCNYVALDIIVQTLRIDYVALHIIVETLRNLTSHILLWL